MRFPIAHLAKLPFICLVPSEEAVNRPTALKNLVITQTRLDSAIMVFLFFVIFIRSAILVA